MNVNEDSKHILKAVIYRLIRTRLVWMDGELVSDVWSYFRSFPSSVWRRRGLHPSEVKSLSERGTIVAFSTVQRRSGTSVWKSALALLHSSCFRDTRTSIEQWGFFPSTARKQNSRVNPGRSDSHVNLTLSALIEPKQRMWFILIQEAWSVRLAASLLNKWERDESLSLNTRYNSCRKTSPEQIQCFHCKKIILLLSCFPGQIPRNYWIKMNLLDKIRYYVLFL